jgi:P-type conjugative transfer protein TrbJ
MESLVTKSLHLIAGAASAALTFALAAAPAQAQYEVFDPWTFQEQTITYAQAVQQVAQGAQQLQQLQNQLTAQQAMIQSVGSDSTSATLATVNANALQILQQAQGIGFNSANAGQAFASAYPTTSTVAGFNNTQLSSALSAWQANNSAALQTAIRMQGQVASNQAATSTAVQNAVNASNSAAGQTAAIQATNQLLAAVAAQLAQLQAILLTQGQAQATLAAQQQSNAAAAASAIQITTSQVQTAITASPGVTDTTHM